MATLLRSRLPRRLAALGLAAVAAAGCSSGSGPSAAGPASPPRPASPGDAGSTSTAQARSYAAPLPRPVLLAQGVSSANREHRFRSQAWDFARMRAVFNTVSLLPGDQATVRKARRAGLAVVLEFDDKADFFAGRDISGKIQAIVHQVRSNPGTISAIDVADRLNQDYNARQGLRYLAATGGVFHRELPGVPVLVNAADTQLTCGMPGQASCAHPDPQYGYEINATLNAFWRSGYVNGFLVANNLKNNDAAVQVRAWRVARARWPRPFILWSTCSQMSFPGARQPGGQRAAAALAAAYMTGPMRGGAQGVALWAWHQLYDGSIYTFLNKGGSTNDLWRDMAAASVSLGLRRGPGSAARGG